MKGRHAAPDHTGRAVAFLGLLGALPPAWIVGPAVMESHGAQVGIERPDTEPEESVTVTVG